MRERVALAAEMSFQSVVNEVARGTYFKLLENRPRPCFTVLIHAEVISDMIATSKSTFSPIIQAQASIPAEIVDGVNDSNGRTTI